MAGVQCAALFVKFFSAVIMGSLIWLCDPAEAVRKASTLNLASMRIYSAELQLREPGAAAVAALEDHCKPQLEALREGLHVASTKVVVDPEEARRELVRVNNSLQICSQSLIPGDVDDASTSQLAHVLVTRVRQSVASAESLIDQSDVKETIIQEITTSASDDSTDSAGAMNFEDDGRSVLSVDIAMDDMVVDFCPTHVLTTRSSATIRLDRECGGKFHTRGKYASGVFSIRMRAPERAAGVRNSFFISSNDDAPDVISFDFIGTEPNRVLTSYAVNGDHDEKLKTFHMGFDTTLAFHRYTIKWDATSIIWMVDDIILRTLQPSHTPRSYPSKPGHIFGYSWVDATIDVNHRNTPHVMRFRTLQVATSTHQWQTSSRHELLLLPSAPIPVRPLVIDYCPDNTAAHLNHGVDITFDEYGCGGRVRSLHSYPSGRFSASIKCAVGDTSGLLTSFYISSGEGTTSQDEVDFEFLGDNKHIVQTNFYVNGTSAANELWVELPYDCSSGFHTYTIEYSHRHIRWLVDSRLVRSVARGDDDDHLGAFPRKKMFLYSSVWNASFVNDGGWTGKWHGNVSELPFVARFRNVTMAQLL